jgi:hypothetical protein
MGEWIAVQYGDRVRMFYDPSGVPRVLSVMTIVK